MSIVDSNPALLEGLVQANSSSVSSDYLAGVGTDGPVDTVLGSLFGHGAEGAANDLYDQFSQKVIDWHNENPNIEVHVSVVGFSRGTGTTRHFANLIHDRGVPAGDARVIGQEVISSEDRGRVGEVEITQPIYDKYLIKPGEVKTDTVLTYDSVITGQESRLNMNTPPR